MPRINFNRDIITADMSMDEIYRRAGIKKQKPAQIKSKYQEIIDKEIDTYIDALFDGHTPLDAKRKAKSAGEKRKKLNENREIFEYDDECDISDIDNPLWENNSKKSNKVKQKEFSFREYTIKPIEKEPCLFTRIWRALFGNKENNDECLKIKF